MLWRLFAVVAALSTADPLLSAREIPNHAASPVAPAAQDPTYVVLHRNEQALRDRLHRASALLHDGGGFLVAELTPALRSSLAARGTALLPLPALAPEEELWVVGGGRMELEAHAAACGARVLFADGTRALVAARPDDARTLRDVQPGRHLHGGLTRVRRTAMVPPRGFQPPGGPNAPGGTPDPRIQDVVDLVDVGRLQQMVISLSAINTRCAAGPGAIVARDQIAAELASYGYAPVLDSFSGSFSENVVVELPGTVAPERIVVLGAHYDSIASSCSGTAPGADDNATGTAGVLEAARVLALGGPWEHTVRFVLYSAEEYGLVGSDHASTQSLAAGEDILAMLNTDMSAYRAPGDARDVDFVLENSTGALREYCDAVGALYVPGWASTTGSLSAGTSDHQSYFEDGFPAVFYFEDVDSYSPYIHSSGDTYPQSTNDFVLSEMIVKGLVAAAADLADPVDMAITHAPLADSQNPGPYDVVCQVQSLTGATVTTVDLHYAVDGGPWNVVAMASQGSDWTAQIPPSGSPVTVEYYLTALDDQGGSEALPEGVDLGADPFSFFVGAVTVHYFNDFESAGDESWTHGQDATQDDWQHDVVQGKAGDPASAWSGQRSWGNDLGISGYNGEYQPNVSNWLRSPVLDLSAAQNVTVRYRRWLTVEDAAFDQAQIRVNGVVVWQNATGEHTIDGAWVRHDVDVSAQAAGNSAVQVEYRLLSDGGLEFGGWNLDDFSLVSLDPIACPPPVNYCTTSPNSLGSGALIGSNGETSVSDNALELFVTGASANQYGLFYYGPDQAAVPTGDGVRCVGGSLFRLLPAVKSDALGNAADPVDFGNLPNGGEILAGSTWNFQYWYRDPAFGGATYNFSDGLTITFCP